MFYLIAFIGMWVAFARFAVVKKWSKTVAYGGGFVLAIMLISVSILIGNLYSQFKDVDSIESAETFLIGTWVYDQPLTDKEKYPWWEKLVIKNNGTLSIQNANPSDNAWGPAEVKNYKVITEKFRDNGERYYGMKIDDSSATYVISNGKLVMQIEPYVAVFRRGDRNMQN